MKSSFCIDLQRFMLIPTKFPLSQCQGCWRCVAGGIKKVLKQKIVSELLEVPSRVELLYTVLQTVT